MAESVRNPEFVRKVSDVPPNEVIVSVMSNETLASKLLELGKNYPMESLDFYVITESVNRLKSYG